MLVQDTYFHSVRIEIMIYLLSFGPSHEKVMKMVLHKKVVVCNFHKICSLHIILHYFTISLIYLPDIVCLNVWIIAFFRCHVLNEGYDTDSEWFYMGGRTLKHILGDWRFQYRHPCLYVLPK